MTIIVIIMILIKAQLVIEFNIIIFRDRFVFISRLGIEWLMHGHYFELVIIIGLFFLMKLIF